MMTARSADEPVAISVDVSMIGCVMLKVAPGMWLLSRCDSSLDEIALGLARRPGRIRMRLDQELVAIGAERVHARVVSAALGHHHLDFRRLPNELPDAGGGLGRFFERDPRRQIRPNPDHAFVELRQELGADRAGERDRQDHERGRRRR